MLFTLPNFWPYVRRGSERLVHDLASEMTRRGHRVTVLTRGPGARIRKATMDGFDVIYVPTATRLFSKLRIDPVDGFALPAFVGGLLKSADVTCAEDLLVVDSDVLEQREQVDFLLIMRADQIVIRLAGEREDRGAIHLRVVQSVQ